MVLSCCSAVSHYAPNYASTVFLHNQESIASRMQATEKKGIMPCITAWCNKHHKIAFIIPEDIPDTSSYITHMLAISEKLM